MEDGRCKLGLAGRLQLVGLIESGCSFRAAAAAEFCFAGHGASVVASLASRPQRLSGSSRACLAGPAAGPALVSVGAERRGRAADP